jgi:hypothetical protein
MAPRSSLRYAVVFLSREINVMAYINPLPALTLQSARDLNVPCSQKRFKALLLNKKKQDFL